MASSTADGSEDVNDFLQRIKELEVTAKEEDEERNRKLEEEILQGRKERQARRAESERARSVSPTKSSPSNTPTISRVSAASSSTLSKSMHPTIEQREVPETQIRDAMERSTGTPTKENSAPFETGRSIESDLKQNTTIKPSPSSAMPSRTPTLSWQQRRPNSQASDRSRSRPLSMVAVENAARSPRATPEPSTPAEEKLSREQIAQSLASKDPAWFRQTADRGLNSRAYRRSQVEDEDRSDHGSNAARIQMPGMSRKGSQSEQAVEEPVDRSSSPSRSSVSYGSGSRTIVTLAGGLGSPLPLTPAQKLEPPGDTKSEARALAMSPSQGRISPERLDRPPSPTKGMGGFVQSAMMKRSDSVNKRWTVQSPPGLSRGNSVASNRSNHEPSGSMALGGIVNSLVREPSSRPGSSHSNATVTQERPCTPSSMRSSLTTSTTDDGFVKPSLPASQSHTSSEIKIGQEEILTSDAALPVSPTKTMDPKRWSPTKSSWLESALNKPESPKPKATPPPQQPAWMSEINKAKQKSVDLGQSPIVAPKHEVKVGGLMRSPPPGGINKPPSIGGLPAGFSSGMAPKSRPESRNSQDSKMSPRSVDHNQDTSTSTPGSKQPPLSSKIKPGPPQKKDFRAGLKPRQPPPSTSGSEEPEFKNVFGQLRRTKTQNYVAPDELKDNITRGKAALNLTGGPKKTERKDEFKEAILKKKEDFKKAQSEGKGVTRSASGGSKDTALPEAFAKRQVLGRSGSITTSDNGEFGQPSRQRDGHEAPNPSLPKRISAPGQLQGKEAVRGKLAGRFNPALADLLARGPPSVASDTSRSSSPAQSQRTVSMSTSTTTAEALDAGPTLTHMTKGRARGPRRKAPSSTPTAATPIVVESNENKPITTKDPGTLRKVSSVAKPQTVLKSSASQEPAPKVGSENPQPDSPRKLDLKRRSQFLQEIPNKNSKAEPKLDSPKHHSPIKQDTELDNPVKLQESKLETKPSTPKAKPSTPVKSPSLKLKSSPKPAEVEDSPETAKLRPKPLSLSPVKIAAQPTKHSANTIKSATPSDLPKSTSKHGRAESVVSVKSAAAMWSSKTPEEQARARSPIKLPTQDDEKAALVSAGLRSASPEKRSPAVDLGIQPVRETARPLPTPPTRSTVPPPGTDFKNKAMERSPKSPTPQASEASRLLSGFFRDRKSPPEFATDTASILSARPDQESKIKTLRSNLYQLSGDGKKQLVPSHQERILFEGNLYLCTHTFGNTAGKKVTEIYYWLGDDVPDAVATEGKIFAQREARSAGSELVTIRQGKETPEFFSALGGIIIIRRGSSNKYDSVAPHILCGRKHFGQIAFDEVDFSAASLCSGFPYLISTQSGNCYLWKGKGSGIDELSCARLIGMDFGITGEIEEVEDGKEPESLLQVFGNGTKIPKSADHWRMKANYPKYCGRLFLAENAKEQIIEISPFAQSDLDTSKIYILDAFFEIYIIVGCHAQSQYASFHNALMFAQEYGILAAGMEDRPFVPFTTVVMEGVPRDLKSVLRKWKDSLAPTIHQGAGTPLQRGRSLRVVGLNAALEATKG